MEPMGSVWGIGLLVVESLGLLAEKIPQEFRVFGVYTVYMVWGLGLIGFRV